MTLSNKSDPATLQKLRKKVKQEKQETDNQTPSTILTNNKTTSRANYGSAPSLSNKSDPDALKRLQRKVNEGKAERAKTTTSLSNAKNTPNRPSSGNTQTTGAVSEQYKAQKELEELGVKSVGEQILDSAGYYGEKLGRGIIDGLEGITDFAWSIPLSLGWAVSSGLGFFDNSVENWFEKQYNNINQDDITDYFGSAEERYDAAPDWVKDSGWLPETIGNIVPFAVETYFSGGTNMVDDLVAAGGSVVDDVAKAGTTLWDDVVKAGKNAVDDVAKTVSNPKKLLTNPDVHFGMSAGGSAIEEATKPTYKVVGLPDGTMEEVKVREGANPFIATAYGTAAGALEVITEKLFGSGYAGLGDDFGKATLSASKSTKATNNTLLKKIWNHPVTKKIINLGTEGLEEDIVEFADPILQRAIGVDANAEWATWSDYVESGTHGVILSVVMNAVGIPINIHNKSKAISSLNNSTEVLNGLVQDDTLKLQPLPNNATEEQIVARQKEISAVALAFDNAVKKSVQNEQATASNAPEQAAMDVVANRNTTQAEKTQSISNISAIDDSLPTQAVDYLKMSENTQRSTAKGMALAERLEAQSKNNETLEVADVKKATGFGDEGSNLVTRLANREGVTFSQAKGAVETAYRLGLTDVKTKKVRFDNSLQKRAFDAGKIDIDVQNRAKLAESKSASVYETGFTENEYSAKLTADEREMFTTMSKDLKMDTSFVDKIVAFYVNGKAKEANASHLDGKMEVSSTSQKPMVAIATHEGGHRMSQLDPESFNVLMNYLYETSDQNARRLKVGDKGVSAFDRVRSEYGDNNDSMNTRDYVEEIAVRRLETIFSSAEEFNKWRAELDLNPQAKSAWQKFIEIIKKVLEDMWAAVTHSKMSLEAKRQAQTELELFENAYRGAIKAAETRANEVKTKTSDTNSAKNLEIKMNEEYNGNKSYSLQDSADANLATIKRLILAIRGRRGLKYDGGRVIRIPDNDMATLRHKFMTEHHYSNRSGGNIDCIDCFGQGGKKHYFYVFHVGEDNRVAPIFRLDYEYIERYLDDVQKISKEMGYNKDEFVNTASGNGKGIDRIRDLAKGDSVYDVSATGRETNHRSGEVYNSEGGRGSTDNGYSSSGISNGYDKQGNNGNLNVGKKYSLNWRTDLNQAQYKEVVKWLRQEGNPDDKRITDTASWYKGRINGEDLFVIYSTIYANNPTILYEIKGESAKVELNALLNYLEEMEYGESIVEESKTVDAVLENDWVQEKHSLANNNDRLGERGSDTGYASVLQGESSEFIGSEAFRNVVKNLFKEPEVKSYSLKDSEGNILSEEQQEYFKETETQQFKRWFGDWKKNPKKASKVVNEDGTPRIVYHGTDSKFTIFDKTKGRANMDIQGMFFSPYEIDAQGYGANVGAYYLNLRNPADEATAYKVLNMYRSQNNAGVKAREHLIKLGYDGVYNGYDEYIAFYPEQIKSATDNIGTFDQNNPDIRFSLKGGTDVSPKRTTEYLDAVEAVQKGKKGASERLAKYVDSGMIRTEEYEKLIKKYGAINAGERPSRDIQVPKKTAKDKKVSQTVRTILEAKATPDEAVPTIEKMVEDGVFSYDAYTDKQAINDAESYIKEYGWEESLDDWFDSVEKGEVSKELTAMGWALYNNAANKATTSTSETERTTAIKTSLKILDAMVRHQRSAAQALQATRILKKLSPETQLYGVQKSVSALQNELTDRYGDKAPDLKIDEELAEQFLNAKTPEERAEVEREIYKDIGRQMPSRFIDKWNAWRYLAMLGNMRTHGRNILGNAFFAPAVIAKDLTATAIESAVNRVSSKKMVRGKALITGNKADRALLKAAWDDYGNVADMISNGGKYNDFAMANQQIEAGRQIFKFKPLEWARKKNSQLLEVEDMWFSKPHYAYAMAQYCKANNITAEQIKRGKAIAPAREYAIKEAQKATYRDTNAFSQMVSEWGRGNKNEKNVVKKAFNAVIEGELPFRKTPANIFVRSIEYSPLGLLKGLSYDLMQVSKGKMTATEAIDNISAGLTGTGRLALGVYLAAQGLIRGHGEDEEDEKKFKEMMGHQAYSLELPNGQSITLDWLAPEALPFFVGVNIWETTRGTDEKVNLSTILKSLSGITEPMLEMSCLQSLNNLFESIGYASSNDTSGLTSILSSAATSYLMQGLPTLFGQAERTGEENRMTTYTEKNDFLTDNMQYTLGKASAKIPFVDYHQIPYIDAWGRKEASGMALKRGFNNFLNPAYTSTIETSDMEEELLRLYEETGEDGVFPERADKYFIVNGVRKDLTAEEYVRYATLKGEKSYKLVSDLVKSKAYKKLSDDEKAKAVREAYDYANQKAKQAISRYKPDTWVNKADEFGSNVGNYISFKTEVSGTKEDNGGKISKQEVADIILDAAQNDDETWKMYLSMYDSEKDMYAYNEGIKGETYMYFLEALNDVDKPTKSGKYGTYTQEEAYRAIRQLEGLSREEKAILWQSVNTSWKSSNNPFR